MLDERDRCEELNKHIGLQRIVFECKEQYDFMLIPGNATYDRVTPIKKRYVVGKGGAWECKGFELMRKNTIPIISSFQK